MVKTVTGMLPFAVVLAGVAVAIWWMLSREMALGPWVLAGFLVAHGLIHVMFLVPEDAVTGTADWPFGMGRSWVADLLGLEIGAVRLMGIALIAVVVLAFGLAALSTAGVLVSAGWWPALTTCGAAASALLLALFFSPSLVLGIAIDAVLAWVALASIWVPAPS